MEVVRGAYCERGVVLHTTKYGEGQLIVHLLTSTHARRSYIVRVGSSRRSDAAARSVFQPLFLLEFLSGAARGELHKMSDVRLCPPLRSTPYSTPKSAIALFISELLYRVVRDEVGDVFDFVHRSVIDLDNAQNPAAVANFHLYFMTQLAIRLGYAPSLNYSSGAFFDMKSGEFVILRPVHTLYMNPDAAALLHELAVFGSGLGLSGADGGVNGGTNGGAGGNSDASLNGSIGGGVGVDSLGDIALSRDMRRNFLSLLTDYYAYHTESIRSVRSIAYLAELF